MSSLDPPSVLWEVLTVILNLQTSQEGVTLQAHSRAVGGETGPRQTGSRGHAPKTPAADACVLDVWVQASPHMCSENIHGCVCTQRLICGALVNMAAWCLWRCGQHRCRCIHVSAYRGTGVHIPAGMLTVPHTDMGVSVHGCISVNTQGHTVMHEPVGSSSPADGTRSAHMCTHARTHAPVHALGGTPLSMVHALRALRLPALILCPLPPPDWECTPVCAQPAWRPQRSRGPCPWTRACTRAPTATPRSSRTRNSS